MATENSGAPHLPQSWPEVPPQEAPQRDVPPSWPAGGHADVPMSWPDATSPAQRADASRQPSWPDTAPPSQPSWPDATPPPRQPSWPDATRPGQPAQRPGAAPAQQPSWPDATSPSQPSWPDSQRYEQPSWPDATAPSQQPARPEPSRQDPVPAWQEAPPAATGWANLSSPAPWPQADQARQAAPSGPETRAPQGGQVGAAPFDERTMQQPAFDERTMQQSAFDGRAAQQAPYGGGTPLDERAMPQGPPQPAGERPGGEQQARHGRPGANLSRDPSDPDRPFVTAGQISGSRTPPPERQQQLWDTVFGDDYQSMDEPDSLDDTGKPIWIYALAGSVGVALVGALLWAFLAGPLAGDGADDPVAQPSASASATAPKKTSNSIGRLRTYAGTAAPVVGVVQSPTAGVSVPRLGGTWQLDQRATVQATYGFETRQHARVGDTQAELLTGPLPQRMASAYTSGDDLEPVIKAVVVNARKRFFPPGNQVRKIAQQPIKVGDATGRLIAYSLTSDTQKATIVTIAVNSGNDLPAIVYMSVPSTGKQLLPDINTVVKQLKVTAQS